MFSFQTQNSSLFSIQKVGFKVYGVYHLKLKKLIVIETVGAIAAVVLIAVFVGITPYLASSGQNSQIGVFNQRQYAQETVTLQQGQRASLAV